MNHIIIKGIIIKALSEEVLSTDEKEMLDSWLAEDDKHKELYGNLGNQQFLLEEFKKMQSWDWQKGYASFSSQVNPEGRVVRGKFWYRYVAAAVVLLVIATAFWLYNNKPRQLTRQDKMIAKVTNDVQPGKTKAVLTLADGSKIVLDSAANGKLAQQGGATIINKNGELVYDRHSQAPREMLYNILSTNKGETYATSLSDGSKIWLNSGSSIRYPVVFAGNERKVEITGEAYFEVAHNPSKPFVVQMNDMQVQVLGTHFNINAYTDEPSVKTTLLQGLVKVSVNGQTKFLQPGQQAQVSHEKQMKLVKDANIDEVMAWKNGRFFFVDADITVVARQLERWYNIEVVYEGEKPKQTFGGELQRSLKLSQVLHALERSGLHFRIEGQKLIITN